MVVSFKWGRRVFTAAAPFVLVDVRPLDVRLISTIISCMKPSRFPLGPSECFSFALRRAARTVSRRYDEALAPVALNNGQFSMLALLSELGPIRIQKIAETLAMDRTTVTAALKPLQRRKLVRVDVAKDDTRARDAVLTPAGKALLREAIPLWRVQQEQLTKMLSAEDAEALRAYLGRLV
jgi:DNA-binding MarR family transcriptional regulator